MLYPVYPMVNIKLSTLIIIIISNNIFYNFRQIDGELRYYTIFRIQKKIDSVLFIPTVGCVSQKLKKK